jgi:hypothetical protein
MMHGYNIIRAVTNYFISWFSAGELVLSIATGYFGTLFERNFL